jgi:hypothetical protein
VLMEKKRQERIKMSIFYTKWQVCGEAKDMINLCERGIFHFLPLAYFLYAPTSLKTFDLPVLYMLNFGKSSISSSSLCNLTILNVHLMKIMVIPETRREHYIRYLRVYSIKRQTKDDCIVLLYDMKYYIYSLKPITNTAWVRARLCKLQKGNTRLAAASANVYKLLTHGRWFSPGTPASSTTKTGRHDIADILLKVALNTINK